MVLSVSEDTFLDEVLRSPLPVLVNFWAPWCGLCRLIEPILTKLQNDLGGRVKLVSINADENFKLANAYRLQSLPTLLLINQGNVLHRLDTVKGHDDLRQSMDELRQLVADLNADEATLSRTITHY